MATGGVFNVSPPFPVGQTGINVYKLSDWPVDQPPRVNVAPPGTAVVSGLVADSSGNVAVGNVLDGGDYVLGAQVAGVWTYARIRMAPVSSSRIQTVQSQVGNRVAMLGDSITIGNTGVNDNFIRGDKDPLWWAHLLTDGKIGYQKNAGVSGNKLSDMLARIDADVIATSPDWCVILSGTNDASNGVTVAQYAAQMQAVVSKLIAAGIRPAICTPCPNPAGAQRTKTAQYDSWIRTYCQRTGIAMVDVRKPLIIGDASGGYAAGFDGGDGIHPTNLGAQAIGQAIVDAISAFVNPDFPPISKFQTADSPGLLSTGFFLTNTAGVGTGWTKSGAGIGSIVAPAGGDAIGNWQRLADTVNEFTQINSAAISAGFAVGDRLAITGRFRTNVTNGQTKLVFAFAGSGVTPLQIVTNPGLGSTNGRSFYQEVVVPAGTTSFNWSIQTQAGTGMQIDVAQLDVINLTALGL